jgi:hypothetical protein
MSPVDPCEFICQDELYKRRAKNAASCASAGSPYDFVLHAGFVRVPQNLISEKELSA